MYSDLDLSNITMSDTELDGGRKTKVLVAVVGATGIIIAALVGSLPNLLGDDSDAQTIAELTKQVEELKGRVSALKDERDDLESAASKLQAELDDKNAWIAAQQDPKQQEEAYRARLREVLDTARSFRRTRLNTASDNDDYRQSFRYDHLEKPCSAALVERTPSREFDENGYEFIEDEVNFSNVLKHSVETWGDPATLQAHFTAVEDPFLTLHLKSESARGSNSEVISTKRVSKLTWFIEDLSSGRAEEITGAIDSMVQLCRDWPPPGGPGIASTDS